MPGMSSATPSLAIASAKQGKRPAMTSTAMRARERARPACGHGGPPWPKLGIPTKVSDFSWLMLRVCSAWRTERQAALARVLQRATASRDIEHVKNSAGSSRKKWQHGLCFASPLSESCLSPRLRSNNAMPNARCYRTVRTISAKTSDPDFTISCRIKFEQHGAPMPWTSRDFAFSFLPTADERKTTEGTARASSPCPSQEAGGAWMCWIIAGPWQATVASARSLLAKMPRSGRRRLSNGRGCFASTAGPARAQTGV